MQTSTTTESERKKDIKNLRICSKKLYTRNGDQNRDYRFFRNLASKMNPGTREEINKKKLQDLKVFIKDSTNKVKRKFLFSVNDDCHRFLSDINLRCNCEQVRCIHTDIIHKGLVSLFEYEQFYEEIGISIKD